MTQYELPDGFQGMETVPHTEDKEVFINVLYVDGRINPIEQWRILNNPNPDRVGWAPIVPLKKKVRFVVEIAETLRHCKSEVAWKVWDTKNGGYGCVAFGIPTEDAAQRIADIYNEVMP